MWSRCRTNIAIRNAASVRVTSLTGETVECFELELGLHAVVFTEASPEKAPYVACVRHGQLVFVVGQYHTPSICLTGKACCALPAGVIEVNAVRCPRMRP